MGALTRNIGPEPNFTRASIGPYDPMTVNGVVIQSDFAVNKNGAVIAEFHSHVDSSAGAIVYHAKSRGTAQAPTIVQDGDEVGVNWAVAYDGTDYAVGGFTKFKISGTPGNDDMPMSWSVSLSADGSQSPTERFELLPSGAVEFSSDAGTTGEVLTSAGTGGPPTWSAIPYTNPNTAYVDTEQFGAGSFVDGDRGSAFGNDSLAWDDAVAIGFGSFGATECVAIGVQASADNATGPGNGSTAIGFQANATDLSVAIGYQADSQGGVAIGLSAEAIGLAPTGIGYLASALGNGNVAIGSSSSTASGTSGIAIGNGAAIASGTLRSVCIGVSAVTSGGADDVIAIGFSASSAFSDCIAIGTGAVPTAAGQALIGGQSGATNVCPITAMFVGRGVTQNSPDATVTITTTGGGNSTNNIGGSALNIQGGLNAGNNTSGGAVHISTGISAGTSSSTTPQTPAIRATWTTTACIFNDAGNDYDWRLEGDNDADLITADASVDSVGMGIALGSHLGKLHVKQASATGAKPVIVVEQVDLSEEFMRFIGESADDNSQSIIDAANLSTPGSIVGWLKIYVEDKKASGAVTDGYYWIPFYSTPT